MGSWSTTKTTFSKARWDDQLPRFERPTKGIRARLLGGNKKIMVHGINLSKKTQDSDLFFEMLYRNGGEGQIDWSEHGRPGWFSNLCLNWNTELEIFEDNDCPYCAMNKAHRWTRLYPTTKWLTNILNITKLARDPENALTVLQANKTIAEKLRGIGERNCEDGVEIDDPKHGLVMNVQYNDQTRNNALRWTFEPTAHRFPIKINEATREVKMKLNGQIITLEMADLNVKPIVSLDDARENLERLGYYAAVAKYTGAASTFDMGKGSAKSGGSRKGWADAEADGMDLEDDEKPKRKARPARRGPARKGPARKGPSRKAQPKPAPAADSLDDLDLFS